MNDRRIGEIGTQTVPKVLDVGPNYKKGTTVSKGSGKNFYTTMAI